MPFPRDVEHLAKLSKSREPPVTLFFREAVVRMVVCVYGRIVRVPKEQSKLNTTAPIFRDIVGLETVFEIYGALVDIVTKWKEENAPVESTISTRQTSNARMVVPWVTSSLEDRAVLLLAH
jgi:hypothetical protein